MRDVLSEIERWRGDGKKIALATVASVWGSAPRPLGSKMAITADGEMAGSVSGGCVEGAVFEEAQGVLERDAPRLVSYGVSHEEAWAVGLSCGGKIEVFVEPLADAGERGEIARRLERGLEEDRPVALATVLGGERIGRRLLVVPAARGGALAAERLGGLGSETLERAVEERIAELLADFRSSRESFEDAGETVDVFIEIHAPRPKLVIVGAVHAAIPLITFAQTLGFSAVVVDPRTAFATPERFPHADALVTDWPDEALRAMDLTENTFIALLSHDLKLDIPALEVALPSPVRYVGALGSKKTHGKRVARLREAGVDETLIERIHNPIGLDLGGRRAEEIALAIVAEMVAVRYGKA